MFIGHFAVGMAGKKAAPRVSLPVLFLAAQFADTLWPVLVAGGIETVAISPGETKYTPLRFISYPWSHSLLMLIVWGLILGTIYRLGTGDRRGGIVIGALVVSHWILDWLTHEPDMPLYPGSAKFGLGLWNHPVLSMSVEVIMFAIGAAYYRAATKPSGKKGSYSFLFMILLLLVSYAASSFGPPPPSVTALWATALVAIVAILALSGYVDRHRTSVEGLRS